MYIIMAFIYCKKKMSLEPLPSPWVLFVEALSLRSLSASDRNLKILRAGVLHNIEKDQDDSLESPLSTRASRRLSPLHDVTCANNGTVSSHRASLEKDNFSGIFSSRNDNDAQVDFMQQGIRMELNNKPLSDQGPFDIVLHKIVEVTNDILKIKQDIKAGLFGEAQSWGHAKSNLVRIQGLEPKLEIPFSWVVNNLMNPEYFLHMFVCLKVSEANFVQ
ncbi:hypothetical protein RIF29_24993 [Crotalaria pallida]|uniref:Autophagy protein 5 n=1 Tax=Crotalaria pallida TaxID=3830 RepID=A0AAN9ELI1_CROPI